MDFNTTLLKSIKSKYFFLWKKVREREREREVHTLINLLLKQNTSKNDVKAEDASMVKEKRVSWADSNVINSEAAGMKEEVSVKEGELDNGEVEDEDEDEDVGDEREEDEAPNFELPYAADEYDDDDGYDEY